MVKSGQRDCAGMVSEEQSRCTLCRERLRGAHSHPGQWNRELQQFLLKHTEIRMSACVCKPCERSMRRGLGGQFVGEFIPRWIKLEIKKQKQCCCVPGCGKTSERTCAFAPFHMICEAANVSLSEEEVTIPCSPFHMCSQHYYGTYSYCRSVSECALCGSKEKHRAGVERRQSVRPLPQPESITLLLHEIGNFEKCLSEESVVCNSCYQFCKRLLQQCGDVILSRFPGLWVPDTVLLEGMFLINTAPLVTHAIMRDYTVFLVKRFIAKGVKEVHIVYDRPVSNLLTPKAFEQGRRDTEHAVSSEHEHLSFSDATAVPQKWREYLHCRFCKQQLVVCLGQSFLNVVPPILHGDQRVVTSGCYDGGKAMTISASGVEECPSLVCDAEESDTRVWLHVLRRVRG